MNRVPCGLCGDMTLPTLTYTEQEVSGGKVVGRKTYPVCNACRGRLEEGKDAAALRRQRYAKAAEAIDHTLRPRSPAP